MVDGSELQFNYVSYTLIAILLGLLVAPLLLQQAPDIHPYALLRQSIAGAIRNPKESAIYRSVHTPHGCPLVSGLGLPSEQKYSTRNGDIRDIWKLAIEKGRGNILCIKGADIEKHNIDKLTKDINALGTYLKKICAKNVAIYLPNDVENIVVTFACAFYGLTLIILPFEPNTAPSINALLKRSSPDVVIGQGGQLPVQELEGVTLKEIIFVVEAASQHLDWSAPPGSGVKSTQYDEIVKNTVEDSPEVSIDLNAPAVIIFGPRVSGESELVEFSHRNIIAGVASQSIVLSKTERYSPEDVFVPVDTLSDFYTRIHTYVALASGATVALNPIGGKHADIEKCCKTVKPSIICVSPESLIEMHRATRGGMNELWHGVIHYFQTRTLKQGRIPQGNYLTKVNDYVRPQVGPNIRLVFVAESGGDPTTQALSSLDLSDLRVFFKSKVVYGLKHHKIVGPVTQCNVYDYRVQDSNNTPSRSESKPRKCTHFGAVTPGLEIKLKDFEEFTADDEGGPRGEVIVAGLPVAISSGNSASLGFVGKWGPEGLLSYA